MMARKLNSSFVNLLVAVVALAGFGSGYGSASFAKSTVFPHSNTCKPGQTAEECACFDALNSNSIQAIESFLSKFPLGDKPSACGALALNALDKFTAGGPSHPPVGGHGGYGT
jgi:hypothetical protein